MQHTLIPLDFSLNILGGGGGGGRGGRGGRGGGRGGFAGRGGRGGRGYVSRGAGAMQIISGLNVSQTVFAMFASVQIAGRKRRFRRPRRRERRWLSRGKRWTWSLLKQEQPVGLCRHVVHCRYFGIQPGLAFLGPKLS